jgi:two-component system, NarL family, response regulator
VDPSASKIRILIADDHPVFRNGLEAIIRGQKDFALVGEASTGTDVIAKYRALRPDVTLMDLRMPDVNGEDAIRAIIKEYPGARIIVLTTFSGDAQVVRAMKIGAAGYLLKNMLRSDLLKTIRDVHNGRRYIPSEVAGIIAEHMGEDPLTQRELDVLKEISRGQTNKEVADTMGISEETVKSHLKAIFSKLAVGDRTQAIVTALRRGVLTLK